MKKIIAVAGNAIAPDDSVNFKLAFDTGRAIIDNGYRLQCGGLNGVMRAACMGAKSSPKYTEGDIIGLLPSFDPNTANEYVDIVYTYARTDDFVNHPENYYPETIAWNTSLGYNPAVIFKAGNTTIKDIYDLLTA